MTTVLIAEDNEDTRFLLALQLRQSGYTVLEAEDGIEALDQLKDAKPDLLLLDLMMPGLSGFEVLEQIQTDDELPKVPTIVLSALADPDVINRCMGLGAADYVTKPYDPAQLVDRIANALA
jgi:CheY-like chemotaxis protein